MCCRAVSVTDGLYYGVLIESPECGQGQYLAGMAVESWEEDDEALVLRTLLAAKYLAFDFTFDQQRGGGPGFAYEWLASSDYERGPAAAIHNFAIFGKPGEASFCIPVRRKATE